MTYQLSTGICQRIHNATPNEDELFNGSHTLQVLSLKKVGKQTENTNLPTDRYRVVLSDGVHFLQAMLATQLNEMIVEKHLARHSIVYVERLSCNYVQEKRLIIIMALRILGQEDKKIGEPVSIDASVSEASTPAPEKPLQQSTFQPVIPTAQPVGRSLPKSNWHPIEGLSPYQNNWTIKARVTQKSELKHYSNPRGEGKLFNVTFMDETGEIRATAFNQIAEALYPRLEEGKVYYVSKGKVNLAKKKFSNVMNDFEISLEKHAEVEECLETTNLPMIKYSFVSLAELQELAKDSTCDIIAILKEYSDVSEITSRTTNRTMKKRELTLVDKSGFSVRLTLWGNQAENFKPDEQSPVIAFKGVKVGDFGGRSLGMIASSTMTQNPDIPESHALRGWYDSSGSGSTFQSHNASGGSFSGAGGSGFNRSEIKPLLEMKLEANRIPESEEKPVYFSTRAMVMHVRGENIAYPACETCNKKIVEDGGSWRCDKCDKTLSGPTYRYIMSFAVSDHTGQLWFQGFNDVGDAVFGKTANEVIEIKDRDDAQYNLLLAKACCQSYNFLLRAKRDSYNDNNRIRYGVSRILPLNYKEECDALLNLMDTPWGQQVLKTESNNMVY
ncbi:hypothetical protein F5050DRAFT_1569709 [Lentinula boryana]|uniref:Replication protein A subunit n=1 Tax=Lentinula boryana TaxID=40481 RepID=A0ABQ8QFM5_9AGAR|nr:hypothetical protein F5050DRAFT_1569709 [Lentinula boryana]